jgi:acetyl-CoA carboxylase biotin carboxylase subunit
VIEKILVANRGEIAVRVIRACRELGIPSVAVYSEADQASLHVQMADEAYSIGPPSPLESYLNIDRIVSVAKECGAKAIHPGYGFLSENPRFAERCEKEGLVFIGPTSKALALVGDKLAARRAMISEKVPVIPGMEAKCEDLGDIASQAETIGYPVIVKASAGGGGKGMRIVRSGKDLESALQSCSREAMSAFGDDTVYVEKYIENPHHVEFQVLADTHGNVVHLFERECSIQRRHQKIVEESPSPALTEELRAEMGETAVRAAKAVGYTNAGTVEFLLDPNGRFYFLEVNARLQVEHPVTEWVTGEDLVRHQIAVASGEKLALKQSDLRQKGHAIECRIYAEDSDNDFLPSAGRILYVQEPVGPGVRCDSGIYSGFTVPVYYDPILSKLIVWAESREAARIRMARALETYVILGIQTTIGFLKGVIEHPDFVRGQTDTSFIEKNLTTVLEKDEEDDLEAVLTAAAVFRLKRAGKAVQGGEARAEVPDPWRLLGDYELGRK